MKKQEKRAITAPTQKRGCRAPFDSEVVILNFIILLKFCGKNPRLRVAAKRYHTF
jgi:hypothetical protein